jgi:hypothetical protein
MRAIVICLRSTNAEKVQLFTPVRFDLSVNVHDNVRPGRRTLCESVITPDNYFTGSRRKGGCGSIVRMANWLVDGGEISAAVSMAFGTTTMQEYGAAW